MLLKTRLTHSPPHILIISSKSSTESNFELPARANDNPLRESMKLYQERKKKDIENLYRGQ